MSLWVKICGNTTLADAQLAAEAGADAVGFVFAPSPRRVTPEQVAAITPHLPDAIEKIGVFVGASLNEIAETIEDARLTGVQLHSSCGDGLAGELRARFGPDLRILQVIHFGEEAPAQLHAVSVDSNLDGVLIDSRTATAQGGTGIAYDWEAAQLRLFDRRSRIRLVVAGGLNPVNVGEAIRILRPWGVDVVTGVESSPGVKDAAKVRAFLEAARQTARNSAERTASR